MAETVDVLVSGAGPVGLFCTYLLIKNGHSVHVLDKKPSPTDQSRAFGITPRTLQILQHHGIAHRILQKAVFVRGMLFHLGGGNFRELYFEEFDTTFPHLTVIGQSEVEKIFVDEIEKLQGQVHWNTELLEYEQHEDYVSAQVKDASGTTKRISAKYIVGADGCHSIVRKHDPTWTYEGNSIKSQFALADMVLEGADISKLQYRTSVFYHPEGSCALAPLPHKGDVNTITVRMVANMGPYVEDEKSTKVTHGVDNPREVLTLEKVKELMNDRIEGLDLNIKDCLWLTYFNVNERIANGFRRNRAFLAGDAAHCHSPAGGQGLNIGLQDAENLAWKLSLVLSGKSSDSETLLQSYVVEREPMVKSVMAMTGTVSRVLLSDTYVMSTIRSAGLSLASSIPALRRKFLRRMYQIDFKLGESPIVSPQSTNQHQQLIPTGHFMKDTKALLNKDVSGLVERKTIYQVLEKWNTKHTAIWMITRQTWQQEPELELTNAFINEIKRYDSCRGVVVQSITQYGNYNNDKTEVDYWIDTHAISSGDSLTSQLGFGAHLTGTKSTTPPAALVILRPDRYVAYSGLISTKIELDQAFAFVNSYLLTTK
ncbi:FAD binding domain-containing protein [Chlamydoabsidia padenii]|nr:FAD binding domain-containing protein [Chlamydoabsidia padenii]